MAFAKGLDASTSATSPRLMKKQMQSLAGHISHPPAPVRQWLRVRAGRRADGRQAGIEHRYLRPPCLEENGKVERSHRIDAEEFWSRVVPPDFATAFQALGQWERFHNFERFSLALHGQTRPRS